MANFDSTLTIEWELRDCEVDGRPGLFHTWEHYSRPVEASLLRGGAPAGFVSGVLGIIEFSDGVKRVDPERIRFCDDRNGFLCDWEEYRKSNPDTHA